MAHIPYGYKIVKGRGVLDAIESEKVRRLFEEYMSGSGLVSAADRIGISRSQATLGRMIDSKVYMGDDFYPAIIGEELWNKAQAERKRRVEVCGKNKNFYAKHKADASPFLGEIFCSECGSEYRRYLGNGKEHWRCSKRLIKGKLCCNSPKIAEHSFEDAFMRVMDRIDISEITTKPLKKEPDIIKKYDDPFEQAEYAYSKTPIDDFDFQTKKLLAILQDIPAGFDGEFMKKVIKRIDVSHEGTATFVLISDKQFREELI